MNLKTLVVTGSLYAEALKDLSDTVDALEKTKAELVQAQSLLKGSDEKKATLEQELAALKALLAPKKRLRNKG